MNLTTIGLVQIENLPNVLFVNASSRCHQYALDFVAAAASLATTHAVYRGDASAGFLPQAMGLRLTHQGLNIDGSASGFNLTFYPHYMLHALFCGSSRQERIPYVKHTAVSSLVGPSTGTLADTFESIGQVMFLRYYEHHFQMAKTKFGPRSAQWPSVLQFAALIRDAMGHGGKLKLFSSEVVRHFNLSYSQSDNGRRILHNDLTCADLFLLMLEIDCTLEPQTH